MVFWVLKVRPLTGRILSPYLTSSDRLLFCVQVDQTQYVSPPAQTTGGFPTWQCELVFVVPMTKRITLGVHNGTVAMGFADILLEKILYAESRVLEETLALMDYYGRNAGEIRVAVELAQIDDRSELSQGAPCRAA